MNDPTEAYALVTATFRGTRYVLLIETDSGWAMPGGAIEPGERPAMTAARELWEGAGLILPWNRFSPDPDGAVTVVARCDLGEVDTLPEVRGGGDHGCFAEWVPIWWPTRSLDRALARLAPRDSRGAAVSPTEALALVTATLRGVPYVLLIETDSGWAMPGGAIEPGQGGLQVATRKLEWQTALDPRLPVWKTVIWTEDEPRRMPDPDGAVTVIARCDLGAVDALPEVRGGDDAQDAGWWRVPSDLMALSAAGMIFPAHREILGALR